MPKTKRYRQARAVQEATGARYTEALASQAAPEAAQPPVSRPKENQMEFTMQIPGTGQQVTGASEEHVRRVVESIAVQRIARTAWPKDSEAAMSALAGLFPSMRRFDGSWVAGTNPWQASALNPLAQHEWRADIRQQARRSLFTQRLEQRRLAGSRSPRPQARQGRLEGHAADRQVRFQRRLGVLGSGTPRSGIGLAD
jgi:hypothetical protein